MFVSLIILPKLTTYRIRLYSFIYYYIEHASHFTSLQLFDAIESQENQRCKAITWSDDGKSFCIKDSDGFMKNLVPKHFKPVKFNSFVRRLGRWGFETVSTNSHSFKHVVFQRGKRELVMTIRCPKPLHQVIRDEVKRSLSGEDTKFADGPTKKKVRKVSVNDSIQDQRMVSISNHRFSTGSYACKQAGIESVIGQQPYLSPSYRSQNCIADHMIRNGPRSNGVMKNDQGVNHDSVPLQNCNIGVFGASFQSSYLPPRYHLHTNQGMQVNNRYPLGRNMLLGQDFNPFYPSQGNFEPGMVGPLPGSYGARVPMAGQQSYVQHLNENIRPTHINDPILSPMYNYSSIPSMRLSVPRVTSTNTISTEHSHQSSHFTSSGPV